jgi:hypothetical protein
MTLIIKPEPKMLTIKELEYFVLRYVWEQEKMTLDEIKSIFYSIKTYTSRAGRTLDQDIYFVMRHLSKIIVAADEGKYADRKALYKQNNIDWRKVYKVPGAHNLKDLIKAQETLENWEKSNPELATPKLTHERTVRPN